MHAVRNRSTNAVYAIKVSSYGSKVSPGANDCVRQEYKVLKAVEHVRLVIHNPQANLSDARTGQYCGDEGCISRVRQTQ